jgi:hypothetical protein
MGCWDVFCILCGNSCHGAYNDIKDRFLEEIEYYKSKKPLSKWYKTYYKIIYEKYNNNPDLFLEKLNKIKKNTKWLNKCTFLTANNKVLSAYVGKDVNPVWRLDKEDANALYFTYIPLSLPKVLSKMAKATAAKNLAVADNAEEVSNEN